MPDVFINVKAKDQASKVFKGIGGSLKGLGKALGGLPGPIGELGQKMFWLSGTTEALGDTIPGITSLTGSLGSLSTMAVGLGVAALAGVAALTVGLFKLGMAAIPVEQTRLTFERLTKSIGESADVMLGELRPAAMGMVSDAELMASANKLISMGLADSAEKAGELTQMAVTLGIAMGKGPTQAMEEFALMLANQSIPRLDTFGISAGKVRTRINELMAADKSLTRETAFLAAVTEQGAISLERLGDVSGTAAVSQARMQSTMENLKDTIGLQLVPALKDMYDMFNDLLVVVKDTVDWLIRAKEALIAWKVPDALKIAAQLMGILPGRIDLGALVRVEVAPSPELGQLLVVTAEMARRLEVVVARSVTPVAGYQYGGVVPGPIGRPQLAVVHGGEIITPPGVAPIVVNIENVYGADDFKDRIVEVLDDLARR